MTIAYCSGLKSTNLTEQSVTLCSVIWRQYLHTIFMGLFFLTFREADERTNGETL